MASLSKDDVREIIEMLENELNLIKMDKIEKMKLRSKIRKQVNWLLWYQYPVADRLFKGLEQRLCDVFSRYSFAFCDEFKKLLGKKVAELQKRNKEKPWLPLDVS